MKAPEVKCRLCAVTAPRVLTVSLGWARDRDGHVCPNHVPIDWGYARDICSDAVETLHDVTCKLAHRQAGVLETLTEAERMIAELREVVAPLRRDGAS